MAVKKYTEEHIQYLREIAPGKYNDEITRLFNRRFGMDATEAAISTLRRRHQILLTVPKVKKQYTQEQVDYLRELSAQGLFNAEITKKFNKRFGTNKTESAIQNMRRKYGIKTSARYYFKKGHKPWNKGMKGLDTGGKKTRFKKGNTPQTWVPVGTEVVDPDGYTKLKVADPNKWRYKHRMIWEKHNGPIPKGHVVIFGDGDKRNFDPDNLLLVSRSQLARLNQNGLIQDDARLTRTGIIIADIYNKIGEQKRKQREAP